MKCLKCGYNPEEERKEIELIQKIMSLSFQGKKEEAEKLAEKFESEPFKLDKDIIETYNKIKSLIKDNKKKEAMKLIKVLEKKGCFIKISD
ncbi:MAG: hypothetical protein ISS82_03355 [Nanoarchaeota archaeon]|nr:hypothetical protein [Nanoarchaeota archaeon]